MPELVGSRENPATTDDIKRGRIALLLYAVIATAITVQQTVGTAQSNNFAIFRASFGHLQRGQDLYAWYLAEHWDLFKYPPSCAILFAPFSVLPYNVGLLAWNFLNAMTLCGAIVLLLPGRAALAAVLIMLLEAVGSLQNTQSNPLLAALMILSVVLVERQRVAAGALAVVIGATIKVFPASIGLIGLTMPMRWRHVAWCLGLGIVSLLLPLLVTTPDLLMMQYHSWVGVSRTDNTKIGMAWIGGLLELVTGHALPHAPFQLAGVAWVLFVTWLLRTQWYDGITRRLLLASLLLFSVVFNHMAESPTFVIAYAGIGIWWATMPREKWRDVLVLLIVLLGSVGGSDIVPKQIRTEWHNRIQLKGIVTMIGWFALQYDLIRLSHRPTRVSPMPVEPAPRAK